MKDYYSKRAREYEQIYYRDDPQRQNELEQIKNELGSCFQNETVLEAACGTGYWTEVISRVAKRTTAFDFSKEVLEVAKSKKLNAEFIVDNIYEMKNITGFFNSGCANFLFSHIPKNKINDFLNLFHSKLQHGSIIFMTDNIFIEGVGGNLLTKPGDENTYKRRVLSDGTAYEIIKNYYSEEELKEIFNRYSSDPEVTIGKCFWRVKYKID